MLSVILVRKTVLCAGLILSGFSLHRHKAFKALKEALKADYRSWQIWENFLLVNIFCLWERWKSHNDS